MWQRNKYRNKLIIRKRKSRKTIFFVAILIFLATALIICYLIFFRANKLISPLPLNKYSNSLRLEEGLKNANIQYQKTKINDDSSLLVILNSKEEVIFSSKKQLSTQIASLQLIIKRLTIEGKRFKSLDFRYDKPLIVF